MNQKENPNNQKPDPNSVRRQRAQVKEILKANTIHKDIIQRCPYTCVMVYTSYESENMIGVGFAKVTWPDLFLPSHGVELATEKAYANLAKDIVSGKVRTLFEERQPTPAIEF